MSYILDALQKANAERELASGAVPGLQAQSLTSRAAPRKSAEKRGAASAAGRRPLVAGAIGIAALLVLVVAAWLYNAEQPGERAALYPSTDASVSVSTSGTPATSQRASEPATAWVIPDESSLAPSVAASKATQRLQTDKIQNKSSGELPAPSEQAVPSITPRSKPSPSLTTPAISTTEKPRAQASLKDAAEVPFRKLPTAELSADLRQALPKLAISGGTYSDDAAFRMVIINGQVYREGESPASEVTLENIQPRQVVFNFRGNRFTQSY